MLVGLAALLVTAMTGPALGRERTPTGNRINLFGGDQSSPADTSFYVVHGNASVVGEDAAIGRSRFVLEIDGAIIPATSPTREADGLVTHLWVFNFPDGMTAAFTVSPGHWWQAPCRRGRAIPRLRRPSTATTPVEDATHQITVTFISE